VQTASLQVVQRGRDACSVRVDGAVSAHLVADLRRLGEGARQMRLDLRGAWMSAEGADALRNWHRTAGSRLELVLPASMSVGGADIEAEAADTATAPRAAPGAPVDLPEILAHEVRGPLAIAHLRLQTLAGRLTDQELAEEAGSCQSAIAGLEMVGRLLDTYLTASRPWTAQAVDLAAVCEDAAEAARDLGTGGTVVVRRHQKNALLWVRGERQALYQLVWNLIRNGLEAGAPGGTVRLDLGAAGQGRRTMLRVTDDGPGFPPVILTAPFQQRRSGKPGGMGIGLVLCQWITQRHHGRIELGNGDLGAEVRVELPRAAPPVGSG